MKVLMSVVVMGMKVVIGMKVVMEVKVERTTLSLTLGISVPQKQREVYFHLKRKLEFHIE